MWPVCFLAVADLVEVGRFPPSHSTEPSGLGYSKGFRIEAIPG